MSEEGASKHHFLPGVLLIPGTYRFPSSAWKSANLSSMQSKSRGEACTISRLFRTVTLGSSVPSWPLLSSTLVTISSIGRWAA
ncbi:hypothetical protein M413DRAFT_441754 [Hebeloma cylindrosporum]|uniref:Uncharacterized protein n=1 Tax=Hebeloma cylindrosporum TaxID=76867 RepID=A0A0C3C8E9_HEBCY|nr:hypothetical protein M413DRAFT_441754 [Hebeloma cylindrosporum h7]